MVTAQDFAFEDDLLITSSGDFDFGFSDLLHQQHLLEAYTGHYRQHPLAGAGIRRYINSSGKESQLKRLITIQLQADNYKVNEVSFPPGNTFTIKIEAERIK
jgi:hypothetical protein